MIPALLLSATILLSTPSQGYKILIYSPKSFGSHVIFMGRIADILVEAGHEVVVLLAEYDEGVQANGTRLARIIYTRVRSDETIERLSFFENAWSMDDTEIHHLFRVNIMVFNACEDQRNALKFIREVFGVKMPTSPTCFCQLFVCLSQVIQQLLQERCITWLGYTNSWQRLDYQDQLANAELIRVLRHEKFDLGISEVLSFCGFGLFEKIGLRKYFAAYATPMIEVLTEPFGISYNPSYVPASFGRSDDMMGFEERVENFLVFLCTYVFARFSAIPYALQPFEKHVRRPYTIKDSIETLAKCPYVLVNSDGVIEFPRELSSKIVFVNGITASHSDALSEDFKRLMDAATGGVVLISFGTIARSSQMPPRIKSAFINVFQRFPKITFIWKYEEDDEVASDLPNVIKSKWVPQAALLRHPNMRAFVSHVGTNGFGESMQCGVPTVCIPLFFDQIRSARKLLKQRAAVVIYKNNITAESLEWALKTVLYDKRYLTSVRRISAIVRDVIVPEREQIRRRAIIGINIRNEKMLDPVGRKLNYLKYFYVDVIAVCVVLIALLC